MYSRSKKRNNSIYSNTNYRREMKVVPIIMVYCLLHFDILNFFLGVGLYLTLIFSIETPKFFNEFVKFTSQIAWMQIFTTFLTVVRQLLDIGIIANASLRRKFFLLNISSVDEINTFFIHTTKI